VNNTKDMSYRKRAYGFVTRFSVRYFSRRRSRRVSGSRQYAARLLQPCEQNFRAAWPQNSLPHCEHDFFV